MLKVYVTGGVVMSFVELCCSFLCCYAACYIRRLLAYYDGEHEEDGAGENQQEDKNQEERRQPSLISNRQFYAYCLSLGWGKRNKENIVYEK